MNLFLKRVPPVGGDDASSSEVQINIDFVTTNETTKAIVTTVDNKHKVCTKYYVIVVVYFDQRFGGDTPKRSK